MKTYDKKDVYCITNAQDAKQYINKKGYFLDYLDKDLYFWAEGTLTSIKEPSKCSGPFCRNKGSEYALFLPDDKVKEIPDKRTYRPFTAKEFLNRFDLGVSTIEFRCKDCDDTTYKAIFIGFSKTINVDYDLFSITLGAYTYDIEDAFEKLEYFDEELEEWVPFGVEE